MNFRTTKRQKENFGDTCIRIFCATVALLIFLFPAACAKSSVPSPATPSQPAQSAATSDLQPVEFDACTLFSAAEATQILGTPVRPITNVSEDARTRRPVPLRVVGAVMSR